MEDFEENLIQFLSDSSSVQYEADGTPYIAHERQLVERINSIKIEIYPNEHAPPHFHVRIDDVNASFAIEDCSYLGGELPSRHLKKIRMWYPHAKERLIKIWNETRPGDCQIGKIET